MERETTHALWDREGAYNRLLNDEALLQKMLQMFLDTVEQSSGSLDAALSEEDWASVKSFAHKLKGSSSAVGAIKVMDDCIKIESAAENGDKSQADSYMATLKTDISEIQTIMTNYLNENNQ
jgi:HPt (histidine-containing phosphotransfer) domain-containing protein